VSTELAARKAALRKYILASRDALAQHARQAASRAITEKLLASPAYRAARVVMAYMSFGSEFDSAALLADVRAAGKQLALPRVDRARREIEVCLVGDPERDLKPGVWGIREPDPGVCAAADLAAIDFVLVPGVAFDARCERLGYGGGFYDRLLARLPGRPARIAAAFDVQIVASLPTGPGDRRVGAVLTESAEYRASEAQ